MDGGGRIMKRWHLIIDIQRCENCNNCFLACKDEHCGNDWPGYAAPQPLHGHRWMNILRRERGKFPDIDVAYLPTPCMHCDDPPCRRAAANGAVVKRPDGIVLIDPQRSKGQKALAGACPYGAIWWNTDLQVPQKCTLCAHLLDAGWKAPRCVQACPTGALTIRRLEEKEIRQLVESQGLKGIEHEDSGARPTVYYRHLDRYQACFLAGSLASGADCVAGATVRLFKEEHLLGKAISDDFGDFKFDGLAPRSGPYHIEIEFQSIQKKIIEIEFQESCSVGIIWL
jgi:Fe-S-cluster-containing dehydrogenase component